MTLTFLGQKYETTASEIATVESNLTGKYRGNPIQFSSTRTAMPTQQTLTYRGIHYNR